jgi:hypothetical protein
MAENEIGVAIKSGHKDDYDNPYIERNWYISAMARPNCPKCYNIEFGNLCMRNLGY